MAGYSKIIPNLKLEERVYLDGSRLERHFRNLCLLLDAHGIAVLALQGSLPDRSIKDPGGFWIGNNFGVRLMLPVMPSFIAAIDKKPQPSVWYYLEPLTVGDLNPYREVSIDRHLIDQLISMACLNFLAFYEEYVDVVRNAAGSNRDAWNPVWAFARVVRNAFVHGKVNITDPRHPDVIWHHLKLGRADDGQSIFPELLRFSDIVILMLEMDRELGSIIIT